jgi:hypothetical protein
MQPAIMEGLPEMTENSFAKVSTINSDNHVNRLFHVSDQDPLRHSANCEHVVCQAIRKAFEQPIFPEAVCLANYNVQLVYYIV